MCDSVSNTFDVLDNLLAGLNAKLAKYLVEPVASNQTTTTAVLLQPEHEYTLKHNNNNNNDTTTTTVELLNLASGGGTVGSLVQEIMAKADEWLNRLVEDPNNEQDLAINIFLRQHFLDESGVFSLDTSSGDMLLFASQDKLLQSSVSVESIQISGLDSFTTFHALQDIGNYTVGSQLSLQYVSVQIQVVVDIGISTAPDSALTSSTPIRAVETVQVALELQHVDVSAALFLAMDKAKLNEFEIGNLLQFATLFSCFLEVLVEMALASLNVAIADFGDLRFSGFASPGFDRLVSSIVQAAFVLYKPTLLRALPVAFQGDIRQALNNAIFAKTHAAATCPEPTLHTAVPFLDFRDLLLPKSQAIAFGGTGDGKYGTVMSLVWGWVNTELSRTDPVTGQAAINTWLIGPWTRAQSGTAGSLIFGGDLVNEQQQLDMIGAGVHVRVYDAYVKHLDSFGDRLEVLDPVGGEAHVLSNYASVGVEQPLQLGSKFQLVVRAAGTCGTCRHVSFFPSGSKNKVSDANPFSSLFLQTRKLATMSTYDSVSRM
jgi:hypothetical protein